MTRRRPFPTIASLSLTLTLFLSLSLSCGGGTTGTGATDPGASSDATTIEDGAIVADTLDPDAVVPACENTCTVQNERKCQANQVVTCGNWDDDACLEWGSAIDCQGGCANGFCTMGCENACTVIGSKKCNVNAVQVCGDYDSNGCLEWGSDQDCGTLSCSNGYCAATCTDECTVIDARSCEGAASYKVCGNHDGDDCLEWGTPIDCAGGETCSNGNCKSGCQNECTLVGAKQCNDSNTGYQVCGDYDDDACLEWGTDVSCGEGLVCSNAHCASTCKDECAAVGTKTCNDGKTGFKVCDDKNDDGCLEWGSVTECGEGETCSNGLCASTCKDECTAPEARKCNPGGSGYLVCDDFNDDGCLEWGSVVGCGANETCSGGYCSLACSSECTVVDARTCNGSNTGYRVCKDTNGDGCYEWSGDINCDAGQVCSNGTCGLTCKDECTTKGAKACDGTLGYKVCGNYGGSACLTWGSTANCGEGETCTDGFCQIGCTDACAAAGLKECNDAHTAVRTCGDFNTDGCLEWGTDAACEAGQTCANGQCAVTCADECAVSGAATCNDAATGFRTCDDFNQDGCLELGTLTTCGTAATCVGGACQAKPKPADVLISEVLYDPSGVDTTAFVELWGPAGTSLLGFSLVGVDGATGAEYNVIQLSGAIPADGFFVVAQNSAAYADMVTSKANYQNGPDSIQLRWGDTVVDAVGYGEFSANFAGELEPALDVSDGHSLGRDGNQEDTDNNAADFKDFEVPSPGAINVVQQQNANAPVADFTVSPMENSTVLVDATSSTDQETPASDLEVRWDFQNDGTWETSFSKTKQEAYTYPGPGTYTIKLEVRDGGGKTSITVRTVNLAGTKNIQGEVKTSTWSGIVNIVGHVTVPSADTLTIEAGTIVNVKGLFKIDVKGKIQVKGEAGAPVVFTSPDKTPGSWVGMTVNYTYENYIKFAVFEYADVGLIWAVKSGTLTDSTFRFNKTVGLRLYQLYEGNYCILERLTATKNAGVGIEIQSGKYFDLKYATSTENGSHGLRIQYVEYDSPKVTNCTLARNAGSGVYGARTLGTLDHCDIMENDFGVEFYGVRLDLKNSRIKANRREGIWTNDQFGGEGGSFQGIHLTGNDIFGNATVSATGMPFLDEQISTYDETYKFTGTKYTSYLESGKGEDLLYAWVTYGENESYGQDQVKGALMRNDSETDVAAALSSVSSGSSYSTWVKLANPSGLAKIRGRVVDNHPGSHGTLTLHAALYYAPVADLPNPIEMTMITGAGGVAVNDNYWGVTTEAEFRKRVNDGFKKLSSPVTLKTAPVPGAGVQPL